MNETAVFGGGCFWCTEALFQRLRGVLSVESGYAGGTTPHPTYPEVCSGKTGHAEVIRIHFHPQEISYADLLRVHFQTHDPTTLNRQGADYGTQYRSIILTCDDRQEETARNIKEEMQALFPRPLVTEIRPLETFYKAEEDHQNYYALHTEQAYCQAVIPPKFRKLEKFFQDRLK